MKTSSHSICGASVCVYYSIMTKQLNFLGGEKKKEKNSPTIFDTLNTPKAKMDDAKNVRQKRSERDEEDADS